MASSHDVRDKTTDAEEQPRSPATDENEVQPGHDAAAFLAAIVESSDDAIISKSLSGIITTWNVAAERVFGYRADEAIGRPITMLIPPDRLDEEPAILAKIRRGERVDHFETIRRKKDGMLIDISLTISPIKAPDGKIIGASKIARDISERKRAAEHQELMLREMHHRVKNLFAITGSIIMLASRTAATADELASSMKDRLIALSSAHEMTLPSFTGDDAFREKPTTLFQILSNILTPYGANDAGRWRLDGADVAVEADNVTNLALLFHELATNAAKYGCLSAADGMLEISTHIQDDTLGLEWTEQNAIANTLAGEGKPGFGSRLERTIVQALKGKIDRKWRRDGLSIELSLPLSALNGLQ